MLDQLDDLLALAQIDFAPLYERVAGLAEVTPGELLPGDEVLARGTQASSARNAAAGAAP